MTTMQTRWLMLIAMALTGLSSPAQSAKSEGGASATVTAPGQAPAPGAPAAPAAGPAAPTAGPAAASGAPAPAAGGAAAPAGTPPAAPPPGPPVGVVTVRAQQRDLPEQLSATGAVAPLASVDVRPQMSSVISQVHIREGQFVRKGDLMFTLDARADEANVAKAIAQVARDEASLADAQRQLQRNRELVAQKFISQGALDASQTQVEAQTALVAASRAAIDGARVALSYARIVAPGNGRAGSIGVYPGSSVLANQTTLVTITQLDPISVSFSLPQRHLGDVLAALKTGGGAAVSATLPEGGEPLKGRLQFVDNLVDPSSGTIKVKASFENREARLWPGAFVNVAMTVRTLKDSVVVPQAAIIQSARGPIVYVVQANVASPRPVQVIYAKGDDAAVKGIKPGDRVVLEGRQNLRPGTPVVERPPDAPARGGNKGGAGTPPAAGAADKASEKAPEKAPATERKGA